MNKYKGCTLCPRNCGIDRSRTRGFCGAGAVPKAAKAALHLWEEPCISGKNGSGTIFFSGCNLGCVYCQNQVLSKNGFGKEISVNRLSEIFFELEENGANNINLVTPTHFAPSIIEALDIYRPKIPIVYNCGGYEKTETIDLLSGYIDIYLTDMKYFSNEYALKYSRAENYFSYACSAAKKMIEQVGNPVYDDNGIMKRGVIIRHLCLPGLRHDSMEIMKNLALLPKGSFVLSIMSQYTPWGDLSDFPEINRKLTTFEYKSVVNCAIELGLTNGYIQDKHSARTEYTPEFDLSGI